MSTPSRLLTASLSAAAAIGLAVVPATAALAHDDLASSSPAADSSITADPGVVTLDFTETLLTVGGTPDGGSPDGFAIQVVDPEGMHYESGCVTVQDAQSSTPVALGDAGGYVVLWQVVSSDGHPTSGQFEFDYEPTTLDGAADGLTNAPVCGDAWAGDPDGTPTPTAAPATPTETAAEPEATASPTTDSAAGDPTGTAVPLVAGGALPWPVVVLVALVGAGLIASIIVLVLRRQRGGFGQ
ncbi:copper resistance protein CopC [Herbiconiux moechotypicola]|uniref:CopC domain-containing protein n=1 Tax=Herbiconiux moechotypicola TaxID=637393 RepID=A0ABN3DMM3_9MICO|nr:copper resistance protein CopC [Herbiconiux moechotypicola]MCS5730291.1 copper resistance protein CopC [Herbiconiux moechotypicola]